MKRWITNTISTLALLTTLGLGAMKTEAQVRAGSTIPITNQTQDIDADDLYDLKRGDTISGTVQVPGLTAVVDGETTGYFQTPLSGSMTYTFRVNSSHGNQRRATFEVNYLGQEHTMTITTNGCKLQVGEAGPDNRRYTSPAPHLKVANTDADHSRSGGIWLEVPLTVWPIESGGGIYPTKVYLTNGDSWQYPGRNQNPSIGYDWGGHSPHHSTFVSTTQNGQPFYRLEPAIDQIDFECGKRN